MCILPDPAIAEFKDKKMNKSKSEAVIVKDGDKLFICVETNEEGIADFKKSWKKRSSPCMPRE